MKQSLQKAKDALAIEIAGLEALRDGLDENLSHAIDLILKTEKYLIVVGVGKSGHIGRKIAASFASTGTPAFFMHPTEASHGDLGMISEGCTLLALSNSGESQELRAVLAYANKLATPVIAITANAHSSLGKASDIVLKLPKAKEACPNGLAPTTSTTNTLALGDALMVAVMHLRGFTREDFGRRHPGGKLGLQLQNITDWMSAHPHEVPSVDENTQMKDIVMAISRGGKGCVAVTNLKGHMQGMVTDGDLRRAMGKDKFIKLSAKDIMTASPISLSKDMQMGAVIDLFAEKRIGNAFVLVDEKPVALIDLKSLLEDGYV